MNRKSVLRPLGSCGPGTLYVLATPLGHLEDLSLRAVDILKAVDVIVCEDTRQAKKILSTFHIKTSTLSYHEHNECSRSQTLVKQLIEGRNIALISNAGTPLVSDPGYRLVRLCRCQEVPVSPIPGPSAAIAALSVSGLPTDRFLFVGFLPRHSGPMRRELNALKDSKATMIIYVAPHRLILTIRLIVDILGNRKACLAKEMTKIHESFFFGDLKQIQAALDKAPRGEYTLVIEGTRSQPPENLDLDVAAYVFGLMQLRGLNRTQAVRSLARILRLPRREIYRRCLVEEVTELPSDQHLNGKT